MKPALTQETCNRTNAASFVFTHTALGPAQPALDQSASFVPPATAQKGGDFHSDVCHGDEGFSASSGDCCIPSSSHLIPHCTGTSPASPCTLGPNRLQSSSTHQQPTDHSQKQTRANPGPAVQHQSLPPRMPTVRRHKKRLLDLFSGYGSVSEIFQERGYEVITVDIDPLFQATLQVNILEWEYWKDFPAQHFDVIAVSPPCTEFSLAMTRRPRQLVYADELVLKGLEIVRYFEPKFWFMKNPRTGLLKGRPYMKGYAYVDVDYCCFSDWGYKKPTRIWGTREVGLLENVLCDGHTCPNMQLHPDGVWGHLERLGRTPSIGRKKLQGKSTYRIPRGVIEYVMGWGQTGLPLSGDTQVGDRSLPPAASMSMLSSDERMGMKI